MMLILPTAAIVALIYHSYHAYHAARARRDQAAMRVSCVRASDLEQWRSLDC